MMGRKSIQASGFSAVEAVLVIVVLIGIVGAGYLVLARKHQSASNSNVSNASTSQPQSPPLNGTTASVSQISQADTQAETKAESAGDGQTQQSVTGANTAANNVGGAYNENNL